MKNNLIKILLILSIFNIKYLSANEIITRNLTISDEYEIDATNYNVSRGFGHYQFLVKATDYPKKIHGTDINVHTIRPPYLNNTILMIADGFNVYIYNIHEDTFIEFPFVNYYNNFLSDGAIDGIFSPEWSLGGSDRSGFRILIDKNQQEIEYWWDYIYNEFLGTVFDNEYIMETIRQINGNSRYNIITRYGLSLIDWETYSLNYLLIRLNNYFNVNIEFSGYIMPGIYNNGFFFRDTNKLVFFDLKRHTITEYSISRIINNFNNFKILFSEDYSKIYLIFEESTNYSNIKIYEYAFDLGNQ